jgi:methyltransferase (TIGR00027 family)
MPVDYQPIVSSLMEDLLFINAVAIIEGKANLVYSTKKWDIRADISEIISTWFSMKARSILISGEIYIMRQFTIDRLVATSISGKGHIIGVKDEERIMIAQIEPDGIIAFTTMEMARILASISTKKPYLEEKVQLGQKNQVRLGPTSSILEKKQILDDKQTDLTFTARLMAYYRAQEFKRDYPLISDPFAERLAGNITSYLKTHIRYSEMDYPIVRSNFIEEKLLKPWCNIHAKSQIVLLGAGLDTRAYRFKPFQKNEYIIFEIDFPELIRYKEEILQDQQPLCNLVRLSTDLSNLDWDSQLKKNGFNYDIPTFWILEGVVYYMEKEIAEVVLNKIAEISAQTSQIFVDIIHSSRWISFPNSIHETTTDPFSKHLKWGLNIKDIPFFFAKNGWKVSCSFADEYARDRNVGQKGMIFIHGIRAINE